MKKRILFAALASLSAVLLASCGSNKTSELTFDETAPEGYTKMSDAEGNALWHETINAMPDKVDELAKTKNLIITSKHVYDKSGTTDDDVTINDVQTFSCRSIVDFNNCKFSTHHEMTRKYETLSSKDETDADYNYSYQYDICAEWEAVTDNDFMAYTAKADIKADNYLYITTATQTINVYDKNLEDYIQVPVYGSHVNISTEGPVYYEGTIMSEIAAHNYAYSYGYNSFIDVGLYETNTDHTSGHYFEYYKNDAGNLMVNTMYAENGTSELQLSVLYENGIIVKAQKKIGKNTTITSFAFTDEKPKEDVTIPVENSDDDEENDIYIYSAYLSTLPGLWCDSLDWQDDAPVKTLTSDYYYDNSESFTPKTNKEY